MCGYAFACGAARMVDDMADTGLVLDLAGRLNGKVVLSSDITDSDLLGVDIEAATGSILGHFGGSGEGIALLDRKTLLEILDAEKAGKADKSPLQVEVIRPLDFTPEAKDIDANYKIRNLETESTAGTVADFTGYFRNRFERLRTLFGSSRSALLGSMLNSIDGMRQYASGREVGIVGMLSTRAVTKNGNVIVTLEDESGSVKVLFMKPQPGGRREAVELFEASKSLVLDEVVAVKGKIWQGMIIAGAVLWPDIPIRQRRQSSEDIAMAFISDIHVGSKLFLEKQFTRFLSWLNGDVDYRRDLAGKVKYIVVSGDLVDGIGVYPNQDKELAIPDIYKQYGVFFDLMERIPDYVHAFLLPGNHDAVRRAEPQPPIGKELIGEFNRSNIHFVSDPGYVTLDGLTVLGYHGTSLDSVIQGIPSCSYMRPEGAMTELLRRRHLSPIYGDNPVVPGKQDAMVIDEIPDILHMGHVHKNGYTNYHGTLVVNSGTWQARTPYQAKLGHLPSPAVLPVYEARSMLLSAIDFNTV